jgi:uncharacterized protein (TIGR02611 family)
VLRLISEATSRLTVAARMLLTAALGLVLIIAGVVMLATPGPGWGAIILGLYVLGREFKWARRLLDKLVGKLEERRDRLPKFVGRLLDDRTRRHQIRAAAAQPREDPGGADLGELGLIEVDLLEVELLEVELTHDLEDDFSIEPLVAETHDVAVDPVTRPRASGGGA